MSFISQRTHVLHFHIGGMPFNCHLVMGVDMVILPEVGQFMHQRGKDMLLGGVGFHPGGFGQTLGQANDTALRQVLFILLADGGCGHKFHLQLPGQLYPIGLVQPFPGLPVQRNQLFLPGDEPLRTVCAHRSVLLAVCAHDGHIILLIQPLMAEVAAVGACILFRPMDAGGTCAFQLFHDLAHNAQFKHIRHTLAAKVEVIAGDVLFRGKFFLPAQEIQQQRERGTEGHGLVAHERFQHTGIAFAVLNEEDFHIPFCGLTFTRHLHLRIERGQITVHASILQEIIGVKHRAHGKAGPGVGEIRLHDLTQQHRHGKGHTIRMSGIHTAEAQGQHGGILLFTLCFLLVFFRQSAVSGIVGQVQLFLADGRHEEAPGRCTDRHIPVQHNNILIHNSLSGPGTAQIHLGALFLTGTQVRRIQTVLEIIHRFIEGIDLAAGINNPFLRVNFINDMHIAVSHNSLAGQIIAENVLAANPEGQPFALHIHHSRTDIPHQLFVQPPVGHADHPAAHKLAFIRIEHIGMANLEQGICFHRFFTAQQPPDKHLQGLVHILYLRFHIPDALHQPVFAQPFPGHHVIHQLQQRHAPCIRQDGRKHFCIMMVVQIGGGMGGEIIPQHIGLGNNIHHGGFPTDPAAEVPQGHGQVIGFIQHHNEGVFRINAVEGELAQQVRRAGFPGEEMIDPVEGIAQGIAQFPVGQPVGHDADLRHLMTRSHKSNGHQCAQVYLVHRLAEQVLLGQRIFGILGAFIVPQQNVVGFIALEALVGLKGTAGGQHLFQRAAHFTGNAVAQADILDGGLLSMAHKVGHNGQQIGHFADQPAGIGNQHGGGMTEEAFLGHLDPLIQHLLGGQHQYVAVRCGTGFFHGRHRPHRRKDIDPLQLVPDEIPHTVAFIFIFTQHQQVFTLAQQKIHIQHQAIAEFRRQNGIDHHIFPGGQVGNAFQHHVADLAVFVILQQTLPHCQRQGIRGLCSGFHRRKIGGLHGIQEAFRELRRKTVLHFGIVHRLRGFFFRNEHLLRILHKFTGLAIEIIANFLDQKQGDRRPQIQLVQQLIDKTERIPLADIEKVQNGHHGKSQGQQINTPQNIGGIEEDLSCHQPLFPDGTGGAFDVIEDVLKAPVKLFHPGQIFIIIRKIAHFFIFTLDFQQLHQEMNHGSGQPEYAAAAVFQQQIGHDDPDVYHIYPQQIRTEKPIRKAVDPIHHRLHEILGQQQLGPFIQLPHQHTAYHHESQGSKGKLNLLIPFFLALVGACIDGHQQQRKKQSAGNHRNFDFHASASSSL